MLQHLDPSRLGPVLSYFAPDNTDARQPADTSEWPPAIILNLFYASAVLRIWGSDDFLQWVRKAAMDAYYDNEDDDSAPDDNAPDDNAPDDNAPDDNAPDDDTSKKALQAIARQARYDARNQKRAQTVHPGTQSKERQLNDIMDGVMALWMRRARKRGERPQGGPPDKRNQVFAWLRINGEGPQITPNENCDTENDPTISNITT